MPAGFRNVMAPTAQIWTPLQYDSALPTNGREWGHHLRMLGRLGRGLDASVAGAELDQIARIPVAEFARPPWASMAFGLSVRSLRETVVSQARPLLITVIGAVALVLLVACTNVASLLLARAGQRRHEHATRMALGASKTRVVGRVVTESMLITALAGAVGLGLAQLGTGALLTLRPPQLPRIDEIGVDGATFLFVLAIVALLGVVVAMAPALSLSAKTLTGGGGRVTGSHLRVRRILVVGEVALTVVVLVGAGLLIRSVQHLFDRDAGFDASGTLVMQIHASGGGLRGDDERHEFFRQALAEVQSQAGVTSAALTSQLPLSGDEDVYGVTLAGAGTAEFLEGGGAYRYTITPGYVETMGMTLRSGRLLDARDGPGAPGAVMISESLARRSFPDGRAVGQRLHFGRTDVPPYTVVGVVADVKQNSLAASEENAVYVLRDQWYFTDAVAWLVVRTDRNPAALEPVVKDAVWSIDPNQPIARVATMEDLVAASEATRRFALVIFQTFALLMLVLAAIGIYGVLAGGVAERTREIGIRSALGASDESILGLVVGQGLAMTGVGLLIGVVGAVAATRWMESLMFGISRLDPATYTGVAALLGIVALIACWGPARRAARIDPAIAFKAD
jgi:putative ABC transport system permease protein